MIIMNLVVALIKDQVRVMMERNVQSVFVEDSDDNEEICDGMYVSRSCRVYVHATAPCSARALAQAHPTMSCIRLVAR